MQRIIRMIRTLAPIVVLVVVAQGVAVLTFWPGDDGRRAAGPAGPPGAAAGDPTPWSFQVSGWHIELDDVAGSDGFSTQDDPTIPRVSPYDELVRKHAAAVGFDWRLILSVIFEESRFQPESESPAGAYGLMQVRAIAAREVGETHFRKPEANIRTGVRYLKRLEQIFQKVPPGYNRLALMLAAYNMGPAHVQDAQWLARQFGYNPYRWDGSMAVMVQLLEHPRVFRMLPHGFAAGQGVVRYVDRVLNRYTDYRRLLTQGAVDARGGGGNSARASASG